MVFCTPAAFAMAAWLPGTSAGVTLRTKAGELKLAGIVVESKEDSVIMALPGRAGADLGLEVTKVTIPNEGEMGVVFMQVAMRNLVRNLEAWEPVATVATLNPGPILRAYFTGAGGAEAYETPAEAAELDEAEESEDEFGLGPAGRRPKGSLSGAAASSGRAASR